MKKSLFVFYVFVFSFGIVWGQKEYQLHTIAFYNLENLFDTIDDPLTLDESSPIMELKYQKSASYRQKIFNMAKVLSTIGTSFSDSSPSLIGVAEIENRRVLDDLINSPDLNKNSYNYIHYDSPDLRGIDVALLYKESEFRPIDHDTYEVRIWDEQGIRLYTRDILKVSGYLGHELIHVIINHWPSRRGGTKKSNYKREKAAYVCKQVIDQLKKEDEQAKIIVMGDFNDDPESPSLKNVLLTEGALEKCDSTSLFNPSEPLFQMGLNTLVYRDQLNYFDQIIISASLIDKNRTFTALSFFKAGVFRPSYLTTNLGRFKGYPFRSFGFSGFTGGYSDHYPVFICLIQRLY